MQMGVSYKVVYPEKFLKAQAKREKEIVGKMDEVLRIREKQAALRAQQRIKRDKKKTTLKLNGWRNGYKIQKEPEAQLRPPDRQYDIRVYSLQDKCLWTMPELGEWYNAYAKPERPQYSRGTLRLLPREQLGRHHDRHLLSVGDRESRRGETDEGLSASDVPLQEPHHWSRSREVFRDRFDARRLVSRQFEWEPITYRRHDRAVGRAVDRSRRG